MKEIIVITLFSSILLFPIVAFNHKDMSLFLYCAIVVLALVSYTKEEREDYNKMDFFPWNEVNLVKKRIPNSTVIDCAWYLDQNKSNDIFKMSDPVLSKYTNLPEQ